MPQSKPYYTISERKILLRLLDVIFAIEGLAILSFIFEFHYFNKGNGNIYMWVATLVVYILFFGEIFEMYNLKVANDKYLTFRSVLLTSLLTTIFYIFTPYISPELPENRIQIFYLFLSLVVSISIWRFIYIFFIFSPVFFKQLLLIGPKDSIERLAAIIREKAPDNKISCYMSEEKIRSVNAEFYAYDKATLLEILKDNSITEIVVDKIEDETVNDILTPQLIHLFEEGKTITSANDFKEEVSSRVPETRLNDTFYQYLSMSNSHDKRLYIYTHTILNFVGSLIGIAVLLIILPFVILINLFANKGPLFYRQKRVGKGGKVFKIIKLRTMVPNAEKGRAVWAKTNDSRITRFGKFLRKSRIDEIPQFINVLKRDMNLIGPRPERPEFVRQLEKENPFYSIRHVVRPGLTGWAQVEYPYASTKAEQKIKLRYDLYYIKERNLLMDFRIVIRTISTILFYRGT
jgi:exopolysaccharide biosynthesis polyprenyl glycosylphosphotransferase